MDTIMKGKCLCAAIEVTTPSQTQVTLCHCSTCRRWSGGPLFAVHCSSYVEFCGEDPRVFRSSDWAERGFCSNCGTHLFYRLITNNEYFLPVGIFESQNFSLVREIFIDQKPAFYEMKNETHKLTGPEVFNQAT